MEKTNEKRNMLKRIMLMLCAAVVAISTVLGSGVTEVQAASKAKKAMAAYEKLLRDSDNWVGYTTFGLIDVNRDGIKELVVYDEGTNSTSLIGYVSGKTKELDVDKKTFDSIEEGMTGMLNYKGTMFYSFEEIKEK